MIEGKLSLWQKKVSKVWGKCGVNAGQYCQEVVLEHENSNVQPSFGNAYLVGQVGIWHST